MNVQSQELTSSDAESLSPADLGYSQANSLSQGHPNLASFKYETEFKLPVSLIHVTHECSLVEHKIWLCLLNHACEILENFQDNGSHPIVNFKIPFDLLRFKTNSQHRLKEINKSLSNLRDAEIQIDIFNAQGLKSSSSQFSFIQDFAIYNKNMMLNREEVEADNKPDYQSLEIVYSLPPFFSSIITDSISIEKVKRLFSWTQIQSLSTSTGRNGKIELLIYKLLEGTDEPITLAYETFKQYLGYGDVEENRYFLRDTLKPALKNFNANELLEYEVETDFIRGKRQKIESIKLFKKYKFVDNEQAAHAWQSLLDSPPENTTNLRIRIKQLVPENYDIDSLTDDSIYTILSRLKQWINGLKKKGQTINFVGACRSAFKDKSWIDSKNGKGQSSLILGEEVDDVVVKASRTNYESAVGKGDIPKTSQESDYNNPVNKIAKSVATLISTLAIKGSKTTFFENISKENFDELTNNNLKYFNYFSENIDSFKNDYVIDMVKRIFFVGNENALNSLLNQSNQSKVLYP
ncbi:TPA: hypothetical protein JI401_RS20610, partial [Acinetobacter baumannii]|nr:hypothetical protein [Acinetobacter baumannii]